MGVDEGQVGVPQAWPGWRGIESQGRGTAGKWLIEKALVVGMGPGVDRGKRAQDWPVGGWGRAGTAP